MTQDSDARVYGAADPSNSTPPATQGVRGEGSNNGEALGLERQVALGAGVVVDIVSDSGTDYAEATGRAGLAEPTRAWVEPKPRPPLSPELQAAAAPPRNAVLYGLATAAVGLLTAVFAIRSRKQRQRAIQHGVAPRDDVGEAVVDSYVGVDPRVGTRS